MEQKGKADHIDQLVGRNLKRRRTMLGMSQSDLANAVGVSIQQVQKYEKATNRISSGRLYAFANFLKMQVADFFNDITETTGIRHTLAEDAAKYHHEKGTDDNQVVSEKEVISLIKAFSEIKNISSRKKVVELIKTMHS